MMLSCMLLMCSTLSLKPLHFKLGHVIPVDLLTHTDVKVGDCNQYYDHEQCKGPDQDE